MAATADLKRYRAYHIPIEDIEDLRSLIVHLPQFQRTAEQNGKLMVVEIWFYNNSQAEALLRNWQDS